MVILTNMWIIVKCSKEYSGRKISGKYSCLSKKGKFGEDLFSNVESGMYIYKVRPEFYVIGTRLNSLSFRAFSKSGDILAKGTWNVLDSSRKWVQDEEMYVEKCTLFNEENDKSVEYKPPDSIIVYSKYYNIRGGYRKMKKMSQDRCVYYNEEDKKYLYRNKYCWGIGVNPGSNYMYMKSKDSDVISPELADWKKAGIVVKPYYNCDSDYLNKDKDLDMFLDKDFPANEVSIGDKKHENICWIRASKLQPQCAEMVLFHNVEPNDVLQGSLGDCWLLCAISTLAEFPNFFQENIFKTNKISDEGKYEIKLYNISSKSWEVITIDDRIPCAEKKWYDIPRPLFAQPNENEMYILLLEKALAKVSGSYTKLCGGYPVLAWMVLTGCEDLELWCKSKDDKWTKRAPALKKLKEDPWNFQKMWIRSTKKTSNTEDMFKYLKDCDNKNYVIAASIHGEEMEKARDDGLIERHAYSLLRVFEEGNIKLVQLRNPWGNSHESLLDWCDSSSKWKEHPEIAKKLNWTSDADGLFWISWKDFIQIFDDIQIAAKTMESIRNKF